MLSLLLLILLLTRWKLLFFSKTSSCLLSSPSILSTYHLPWHTFIVWFNNESSRPVSAAPKFVSKDLRQWIFQLSQKIWQPSVPGERSDMRRLAYFHPGEAPRAPLLSPFDYFAFLVPVDAGIFLFATRFNDASLKKHFLMMMMMMIMMAS